MLDEKCEPVFTYKMAAGEEEALWQPKEDYGCSR